MAEKKNQHYVPQFLLRKFSPNGRSIRLLLLDSGRVIEAASIKAQCSKAYFYGKDLKLENVFAEEEGQIGALLAEMTQEAFERLTREQLDQIRMFAYFLDARTAAKAEQGRQASIGLMEELASQMCEANGFGRSDITFEMPPSPILQLDAAARMAPIVLDLDVMFIRNRHRTPFAISDHPVAAYNRFAEVDPHLRNSGGRTGMAARGLQLFLPLSPEWCFAAYDGQTYQYGKRGALVANASLRDVRALNSMQAVGASKALYLPSTVDQLRVADWRKARRAHPCLRTPSTVRFRPAGDPEPKPHEPPNYLIMQRHPDLSLGLGLSFVRIIDRTSYAGFSRVVSPRRNPELCHLLQQMADSGGH